MNSKILALLLILCLLCSCSKTTNVYIPDQSQPSLVTMDLVNVWTTNFTTYEVRRLVDREYGVVCYFQNTTSMSCVKINSNDD